MNNLLMNNASLRLMNKELDKKEKKNKFKTFKVNFNIKI